MNAQSDWPARLTRSIAAQIRHHRTETGDRMSAQEVSDACAALGVEVTRSTLADIENGRRANITVAELLALAYVLGVPPAQLLFPVGASNETELLPGKTVPTTVALQWLGGKTRLVETAAGLAPARPARNYRDMTDAALLDQHDGFSQQIRHSVARQDGGLGTAHAEMLESSLGAVRDEMRHRKMVLPELDPDLAYVEAG